MAKKKPEVPKPARRSRKKASPPAPAAPRIKQMRVSTLLPRERNARTHTDAQVDQIARAISELGFLNPILVGKGNRIMAGHGRLLAAQQLGMTKVPCIIHSHLSAAQERAYVLADNQLAELAGWDQDLLGLELGELHDIGFDLGIIGFTKGQIDSAIARSMRTLKGNTHPDDTPEPADGPPVSNLGDVWAMGNHRIVCGDCTKPDSVRALLDSRKPPNLMVTDPPYGVNYDASWRRKSGLAQEGLAEGELLNDDRADWSDAWALFPGNVCYVWHAGTKSHIVADSLHATDFIVRSQIVWVKSRFAISRGAYHVQHEPAFYAVREGAETDRFQDSPVEGAADLSLSPRTPEADPFDRFSTDHETVLYAVREGKTAEWQGGRKQSTVWQIDHIRNETGHATQKPIECMKRPIENNSLAGETVYEPFSGSGTTVIACEMAGRNCLAIELDPAYVDLTVRRWQEFTDRPAILESTGQTFDEVRDERIS